jgi:hypothetical protein
MQNWTRKWYCAGRSLKGIDGLVYIVVEPEVSDFAIYRIYGSLKYIIAHDTLTSDDGLIKFDIVIEFENDPAAAHEEFKNIAGYIPSYYRFSIIESDTSKTIDPYYLRIVAGQLQKRFKNEISCGISSQALKTAKALIEFAQLIEEQLICMDESTVGVPFSYND